MLFWWTLTPLLASHGFAQRPLDHAMIALMVFSLYAEVHGFSSLRSVADSYLSSKPPWDAAVRHPPSLLAAGIPPMPFNEWPTHGVASTINRNRILVPFVCPEHRVELADGTDCVHNAVLIGQTIGPLFFEGAISVHAPAKGELVPTDGYYAVGGAVRIVTKGADTKTMPYC